MLPRQREHQPVERAAAPDDPEAFAEGVASLAADFVEPAKSNAYNELGDGRQALAIAATWIRLRSAPDGGH